MYINQKTKTLFRSPFRYLLSTCASLSPLHTHFSQHLHWTALEPRDNTTDAGSENNACMQRTLNHSKCTCM